MAELNSIEIGRVWVQAVLNGKMNEETAQKCRQKVVEAAGEEVVVRVEGKLTRLREQWSLELKQEAGKEVDSLLQILKEMMVTLEH